MSPAPLPRRLFAEFLGSAFLAATVVGSGIAAAQLSPGDVGLQLLENAAATAAGLFTFILMFGPVSGAHFNPVVSLVDASFRRPALAPRLRLHPRPDRGVHRWRDSRKRDVRPLGGQHRDHPPRLAPAPVRRGNRDPRPTARDLLVGPNPAWQSGAGRGRRLYRLGLLLHQLDQLRKPRDRHRANVLGHLRRHRAGIGAGLRGRSAFRRRHSDRRSFATLYPDITPEEAAEIMVPQDAANSPAL